MRKMSATAVAAVLTVLLTSACSAVTNLTADSRGTDEAGEQLIEGELGVLLSLDLIGDCAKIDNPEVGAMFECTGTASDGRVATFDATVEQDDFVNVVSTNVIQAELVDTVEEAASGALTPQTGPVEVDCGTETLILDSKNSVACSISDGAETRDVVLIFTSLDPIQFEASVQ